MDLLCDDTMDAVVRETVLHGKAATVAGMLAGCLGIGSVNRSLRAAYRRLATHFDGTVEEPREGWFSWEDGFQFQEKETPGTVLMDPHSILVVREGVRIVVVLLSGDEVFSHGCMCVRGHRIRAHEFVSAFCCKDVHNPVWRAAETLLGRFPSVTVTHIAPGEAFRKGGNISLVGRGYLLWPQIFPDMQPAPGADGGFVANGDVALAFPHATGEPSSPPYSNDNQPAVFDKALLKLAGSQAPFHVLNMVPGVLSVETPLSGFGRTQRTSSWFKTKGDALIKHREAIEHNLRQPPLPGGFVLCVRQEGTVGAMRKSPRDLSVVTTKMKRDASVWNLTNSDGSLPAGCKPAANEEADEEEGVVDAQWDSSDAEPDTDEGDDSEDEDYRPR